MIGSSVHSPSDWNLKISRYEFWKAVASIRKITFQPHISERLPVFCVANLELCFQTESICRAALWLHICFFKLDCCKMQLETNESLFSIICSSLTCFLFVRDNKVRKGKHWHIRVKTRAFASTVYYTSRVCTDDIHIRWRNESASKEWDSSWYTAPRGPVCFFTVSLKRKKRQAGGQALVIWRGQESSHTQTRFALWETNAALLHSDAWFPDLVKHNVQ